MIKTVQKLTVVFLSISMIFSISGCGLLGGGVGQDIRETVDAFFDDVISGDYAENGFVSDYAKDDPFSSLEINDEWIQLLIVEGLTHVRYEIEEARGRKSDGIGECVVIIEVVDILAIVEDLEERYDFDDLYEAMSERRAPTIDIECVFDMEYNSRSDKWTIIDSSDFVEAFAEPYLSLSLTSHQGAEEVFLLFTSYLSTGDLESAAEIYPDLVHDIEMMEPHEYDFIIAVLRTMRFSIISVHEDEGVAELSVRFKYPDPVIISDTISDRGLFEVLLRELILSDYYVEPFNEEDAINMYVNSMIESLNRSDTPMLESESLALMYFDEDTQGWFLSFFEGFDTFSEMYTDYLFEMDDMDEEQIMQNVLLDLIDEGLIDENAYNYYFGDGDISEGIADALYEDIVEGYWVDRETNSMVDYYTSVSTYQIQYDMSFASSWQDVSIVIAWYYEDDDDLYLMYEYDFTFENDVYEYSFWFGFDESSSVFEPGIYYIALETLDMEMIYYDYIVVL